jgi:hypothetical protein
VPGRKQLVQQLGRDEVHLSQVGCGGVPPHPGPVLDGPAEVGVASTPSLSISRITGRVCLENSWAGLAATARTRPGLVGPAPPPVVMALAWHPPVGLAYRVDFR